MACFILPGTEAVVTAFVVKTVTKDTKVLYK